MDEEDGLDERQVRRLQDALRDEAVQDGLREVPSGSGLEREYVVSVRIAKYRHVSPPGTMSGE